MKIVVTGSSGLVGKAIQHQAHESEHEFVWLTSKDCDLTDQTATVELFENLKPDLVIHLAAKVGGLFKNQANNLEMFNTNININSNVLEAAHRAGVSRLIACLSTCIFPDDTTYPINESMLHDGPPHNSNYGYAYAKRMLSVQCQLYNEAYGYSYKCIIPTNIYGPHDNFNLEDAHVIPALVHRCYLAKKNSEPFVVKGTGRPLRQFIHSHSLSTLILQLIDVEFNDVILSVSPEEETSIEDVATEIAKAFKYEHKLAFTGDPEQDGQYKKTASNSRLTSLIGEQTLCPMSIGIRETVEWFIQNYDSCRK